MSLSIDLINQFVKVTNDQKKPKGDTTVYGKIVEYSDSKWVQLDGSELLTPVAMTTDARDGERVTVTIKNHTAIVNGNLSSPSARVEDVNAIIANYVKAENLTAINASIENLNAETGNIRNLFADYATIENLDAANAEIDNLKAGYAKIDTLEAGYAKIETLEAETAKIANLESEVAKIEDLEAGYAKIDELEAGYAKIETLEADSASIRDLFANYATIAHLEANYASIGSLEAETARINSLIADNASIRELFAGYATIGDLNAAKADIGILDADMASIQTLMFGSATGTSIQTTFANAVVQQIGDAQIKSAMIDSVTASKITAGKISTNTVSIGSDDGNLILSDETIQISDENRVRVQLGKDASGDYSINIWDAKGALMFSEGGLTEGAIKEAIIRNDMVSDTANISASKLNIDSLFEEINGSDKTIKSTKVYLDEKNQTLDVSFKQMTTDVEGLSDSVTSQGTAISVIQGQISSKVWQQDIDDATGEMNTKYSNLEQSLNGFKMEVGDSYVTKDDFGLLISDSYNLLNCTKEFEGADKHDYYFEEGYNIKKVHVADGFVARGIESVNENSHDIAVYNNVIPSRKNITYTFSLKGYSDLYPSANGFWNNILEICIFGGDSKITNVIAGSNPNNGVSNITTDDTSALVSFNLYSQYSTYWITFTVDSDSAINKSIKVNLVERDAGGPFDGYVYACMLSESDTYVPWVPSFSESFSDMLGDSITDMISESVASLRVSVDEITAKVSVTEATLKDGYYTKSETNTQIEQKADSITQTVSATYATQKSLNDLSDSVDDMETSITQVESQIQQLPDQINLAVKSISIGGTNLLKNTKTFKGTNIGGASNIEKSKWRDFTVRSYDNSTATSGHKDIVQFTGIFPEELGSQYTLSFYAKGSGSGKLGTFFHGATGYVLIAKSIQSNGVEKTSEDGNTAWTLTNEWKRYWVTWTLKNVGDISIEKYVLFRLYFGGVASICGVQLEKGNKPSDWSYHPEDANEEGASLAVTVDGIYTEVNGENGKFSKLSQKVDGIDTIVNDPDTGYTKLSQRVNGIYADVYDSTGKLETSLKTTKDGLTATINGLQVGCTNLLRNTRDPKDASYWTRGNVVTDSDLNEKVFYLSNSSTTETTAGTHRIRVTPGQIYTVSVYVKRTSNVNSVDFFFLSRKKGETSDFPIIQNQNGMKPTANVWEKLAWTFTMNSESYEGYLRIDHNGSTDGKESILYYTMVKMEKGNRATDWSPSPEEVDERIAGASATATNYLNFSSNGLVVGNHTATTLKGNVLIDTDSVDIRNGTTVLSSFQANDIYLGLTSSSSIIHLCNDMGLITGYKNQFNEDALKLESSVLGILSKSRTIITSSLGATNSGSATLSLNDSTLGSIVNISTASYSSSDTLLYSAIEIGDKLNFNNVIMPGVSITAQNGLTGGYVDVTPSGVAIGPSLTAPSITASNLAWINGTLFDGANHVLWSGAEHMGNNKQITFSEAVSSQPNGIVLIFSRYSSSTAQNYHWNSFFVPKAQITKHSGGGHIFMMTTDGAFGVIASKYLYLRDTGITGNANNETPPKTTGLTYYTYSKEDGAYKDVSISLNNSGFVLRYVIGV